MINEMKIKTIQFQMIINQLGDIIPIEFDINKPLLSIRDAVLTVSPNRQ